MSAALNIEPTLLESKAERAWLWSLGVVAPWYLRESQYDIYDLLEREKFPFVEAGRRYGKTSSILAFVLEKLKQNPGWICRWCFPEKNLAMEVLGEQIPKVQADIPENDQFFFRTTHSVWIHPNGSKLYLRGVNEDKGRSARGPASNIIVCDEYGFWNEPEFIVKDALFPQLENQEGQWLIKTSTPPPNLGHRYYIEWEEAARKNRLITKTIYDNEALGKEELETIIEESGGVDSTSFRRERLCEHVTDAKLLIVPEWLDGLNIVENDYPRPQHFTAYTSGDSGADDNTAVLFGYYDFVKDEDVIEYEYVKNGKTTKEIVRNCKRIEKVLWKGQAPEARSYDASKQLIFDIFKDHDWPVRMAIKDDKLAAIHAYRTRVGARKVKVKRRCRNLTRQLKVGVWTNEKHQDFQRTEGLGHLDAIAAAIYFNRVVDRSINPVPHNLGLHKETHFISPQQNQTPLGENAQALKAVFGKRVGRIR